MGERGEQKTGQPAGCCHWNIFWVRFSGLWCKHGIQTAHATDITRHPGIKDCRGTPLRQVGAFMMTVSLMISDCGAYTSP